eukprot:Rmarinus@m.20515
MGYSNVASLPPIEGGALNDVSVLHSFIPKQVLSHLERCGPTKNPVADPFWGSVLIADMSGFTAIAEKLNALGARGMEQLNSYTNDFFAPMISIIERYNGDILKFCGDALLVVWPADTREPSTTRTGSVFDIHSDTRGRRRSTDIAHDRERILSRLRLSAEKAVTCALTLVGRLDQSSPFPGTMFRLHCAVAVGQLVGLHVGGHGGKWEFLAHGLPFRDLRHCMELAGRGEVVVSEDACRVLKCKWDTEACLPFQFVPREKGFLVLKKDEKHGIREVSGNSVPLKRRKSLTALSCTSSEFCDGLRSYIPQVLLSRLDANQDRWLSELRLVTVLFVKLPDFEPSSTGLKDLFHQSECPVDGDRSQKKIFLELFLPVLSKSSVKLMSTFMRLIRLCGLPSAWLSDMVGQYDNSWPMIREPCLLRCLGFKHRNKLHIEVFRLH